VRHVRPPHAVLLHVDVVAQPGVHVPPRPAAVRPRGLHHRGRLLISAQSEKRPHHVEAGKRHEGALAREDNGMDIVTILVAEVLHMLTSTQDTRTAFSNGDSGCRTTARQSRPVRTCNGVALCTAPVVCPRAPNTRQCRGDTHDMTQTVPRNGIYFFRAVSPSSITAFRA
jgi:hypothetical protein